MKPLRAENIAWLAIDWGTSHLRVWAMDHEWRALAHRRSDRGMGGLKQQEFSDTISRLVGDWLVPGKTMRAIACGMVGSRQGWVEAPYSQIPCPALNNVLERVTAPGLEVFVVPGLRQASPPDVMRGEETQIGGFLASNPDFEGMLVLPGTHSKWARIKAGIVEGFSTFMTGEMFALLSQNSVLRHSIAGKGWDATAFELALAEGFSRPELLTQNLFALRAAALVDGLGPVAARSKLSGYLVGLELKGTRDKWHNKEIVIIAEPVLAEIYRLAFALVGGSAHVERAQEMTLAGLCAVAAKALVSENVK